jgi:hypothetical protein
MAVIETLSEEECYLLAILTDPSGIDLAEFTWYDPETNDAWRAWPFQWKWFRCVDPLQIDQCGRSVGKSLSIKLRAFAFPFVHPGREMVVTAPELVHLEPIIGLIERQFYDTRLSREILPRGRSAVTHRPFQMNFLTGGRIIGRIPQVTGKGVKGIHPIWLELDEAQDYPHDGWTELTETLQRGAEGAVWRAHGVTRGIQDDFYDHTQDTPDNPWTVHRITAMHRPNWTDQERQEKIREYGSRDAPDYRRNIRGLHGDATNPIFVMHRFMRCVDTVEGDAYNQDEYQHFLVKAEMLEDRAGYGNEAQIQSLPAELDFSPAFKHYGNGATVWCGMDVGFTVDPSEILVFVEYEPTIREAKADEAAKRAMPEGGLTRLRLMTRITMNRIGNPLQVEVIKHVIDYFRPKAFGMDKTGNGLPLFQDIQANALPFARVIKGYGFAEKVIVDIDGTVVVGEGEDVLKEAAIKSNVLEYSTDKLRELVDQGRLMLPFEVPLIREFQGQTFSYSKNRIDAYGRNRRIFSQGNFHALDAARMAAMAHAQHAIEEFIEAQKADASEPVFDYFIPA